MLHNSEPQPPSSGVRCDAYKSRDFRIDDSMLLPGLCKALIGDLKDLGT